ncbi:restriction endonuclease subunit S [Burkholderia cepacia]|uniref:restriction endonuclease subunit S n=1 Tax=Burkholderia cepacia TaxID=292 RepID=UPI0009BE618B|nr:restriction endonuclease subunit S [Burkholderia cepacia]
MKLSDLVDFNPKRPLEKGAPSPFIEMADLPEGERDAAQIGNRVFNGGGSKFSNGDTLFARITPCLENGKTAKVSGLPDNMIGHGSTEFIVMAAKDKEHDEDFIYYLARHPEFRTFAKSRMEGTSGRQRVSWQALASYEIADIDKTTRKRIGEILSSLDNRIASNRRVNATLEEIARAIFKDWFVDFGPVRAKMEKRQPPRLTPEISALFPDSLDKEGKPLGWDFSTLGQVTSYLNRGLSPKYIETGGTLVINQKCIRNNTVDTAKARRHNHTLKAIDGRELQAGDILVNSTGIGTLGRVAQILNISETTVVDSHVTVVRASSSISSNFLGLNLLSRQTEIEALGEGSTGQTELSRTKLGQLRIIQPPTEIIRHFDLATIPLRSQISLNLLENKALSSLRGLLLPKLIAGEISFGDAEQSIEGSI